jgi:hypothetical protein
MVETTTQEVAPQATDSSSAPSGAPDLSGASLGELETLLGKVSQGGEQAQGVPPQAAPAQEGQPQPVQPSVAIPDKFKNPDGSVNTEAWAKSYAEAEKQLSQLFQERSEWRKTNEQINAQMASMQEYMQKLAAGKQEPEKPEGEYTPEEIEEMQRNPRSFIQKEVNKNLKGFMDEQKAERELAENINRAYNWGRANVDGFKILEPKIEAALQSGAYNRHPDAVQEAYYSQLGRQVGEIVKIAKNDAFTAGYNKAKEEMGRHVESGGKSTLPVEGGALTPDTLAGMSAADIEKLLPNVENSVRADRGI